MSEGDQAQDIPFASSDDPPPPGYRLIAPGMVSRDLSALATGTKLDAGKAPFSLIPWDALEGAAQVFGYGARKYARDNWRGGMPFSRPMDAALRHLGRFQDGENADPESGLHHLDHAITTLLMLRWFTLHRPDLDDRFKGEAPVVSDEQVRANLEKLAGEERPVHKRDWRDEWKRLYESGRVVAAAELYAKECDLPIEEAAAITNLQIREIYGSATNTDR